MSSQVCSPAGDSFGPCQCNTAIAQGSGGAPPFGTGGGAPTGTGGFVATGGLPGTGGFVVPGTGGFVATGGLPGTGGFDPGTGGFDPGTGGTDPGTGGVPATGGSGSGDELDALRQACVDEINRYRATLGRAPLRRATPEQEACSDAGAKKDGDANAAHSSSRDCPGLGGQNTCPGWPVRAGQTLQSTLFSCLQQMWAEGEPPLPRDQCIQQYQTCFLVHGHYMNMSDPSYGVAACGFYQLPNGSWWMNQNFGR
jgi:hypothetical protein